MVRSLRLSRIRLVFSEFKIEQLFCSVLVLISLPVFMCFIGIFDIASGIDSRLYDFSVKTGVATVSVMGNDLFDFIDESDYEAYRVNCYVDYSVLGVDSYYFDNNSGNNTYLYGSAQYLFKSGNYELSRMNENIITGDKYELSDNNSYCIWLSELSSEYIGAKCGDTVSICTEDTTIEAVVKGIYGTNNKSSDTDIKLSDFYLSAAFFPYFFVIDNQLEIIIPSLNLRSQNEMTEYFFNNGYQVIPSDSFSSLLTIKLAIYLICMFSGIIVFSLMLSMTKLYCNRRKSFYSISRLLGLSKKQVTFNIFVYLQILYSISFIIALPFTPLLFDRVAELIAKLLGDYSFTIKLADYSNIIAYLLFTIINSLAVIINSKAIRKDDIADNIKMGAEG